MMRPPAACDAQLPRSWCSTPQRFCVGAMALRLAGLKGVTGLGAHQRQQCAGAQGKVLCQESQL